MKKEFIGIDVSKNTLDVALHHKNLHDVFSNDLNGFIALTKWVRETTDLKIEQHVFCLEHTGLYSVNICEFLQSNQCTYHLIPGLEIKRSLGIQRGKNDKYDAQAIARYGYLFREDLTPYHLPSKTLRELKTLLSYRAKLIRQKAAHQTTLKELKGIMEERANQTMIHSTEALIATFKDHIKTIEKEIAQIIESESELKQTYEQITSIKGVGMILAVTMITSTQNFTSFKTWRQFACYAGIAPFEHRSGTSYRGKTKVSSLGNSQIKTILSQAAASSIIHNPELRRYYQKRISEGKAKMATLNIIRNKLVSRMFAVAKRQTPYIETHKFAA